MTKVNPSDLRGEALRCYETWRGIGMSERAAMDQVAEAGLLPTVAGRLEERKARFMRMGLSESAATVAATGSVHPTPAAEDGFDRIKNRFMRLGMSESAARVATIGRERSEAAAREAWSVLDRPSHGSLRESALAATSGDLVSLRRVVAELAGYVGDTAAWESAEHEYAVQRNVQQTASCVRGLTSAARHRAETARPRTTTPPFTERAQKRPTYLRG